MIGALLLPLLLLADPVFTPLGEVDGILVESRRVAGSEFPELRLTTTTTKTPESLCAAAFGDGKLDPSDPGLLSRQVLEESTDQRVTYDQVAAPVVSNRDYALLATRHHLPSGACTVELQLANDRAPPLKPGWVRIPKLSGSWHFEPEGDHTRITHVIFTDLGGSLPAFLVGGRQREAVVGKMKAVLVRAGR